MSLTKLRPYAKAIVPGVATLIAAGVQWGITGSFNRAEIVTALGGIATTTLTFLVPNKVPVKKRVRRRRVAKRP